MENNYVCHPCGLPYLTPEQREQERVSTWSEGTCCVCGERTSVTHKRVYNYLDDSIEVIPSVFGKLLQINVDTAIRNAKKKVKKELWDRVVDFEYRTSKEKDE